MCMGASNENEDNQIAGVESADCHRSMSAVESFRVQREMEKEKGVKKKIKKRAGQSRATKFILGAGRIATFLGQSHTLLQILLHKSPGQGIGIYLEIRL